MPADKKITFGFFGRDDGVGKTLDKIADKTGEAAAESKDLAAAQLEVRSAALSAQRAEDRMLATRQRLERVTQSATATEKDKRKASQAAEAASISHAKALLKLENAAEGAKSAAAGLGDELADAGRGGGAFASLSKSIGGGLRVGLGTATKGLGGVALAGGAIIGAGILAGVKKTLDFQDMQARFKVQLGANASEAKRLGEVAGRVYAGAYGDSLGEVHQALRSVMQSGAVWEDASDKQLESVTGKVLNLSKVFEQDLGATTRAVGQMIRTGLAKDADEALDVLVRGFQQGGDKAEDLLDTVNEYGTQWRKVGLSGKQAMGLISQGLRAGARDSDIVADAIKEFSIRAIDGSKLTAQGFKMIGLNAGEMGRRVGAGGKSANDALDLTLDRLRKIPDPVKRSEAAVALFGTQAEDLGEALFALDPSKAVAALGTVGGAADQMGKDLTTPQAKLTAIKRTLEMKVQGWLVDAFEWVQKDRFEIAEGLLGIADSAVAMIQPLAAVASGGLRVGQAMLYVAAAQAAASGKIKQSIELRNMAGNLGKVAAEAWDLGETLQRKASPALAGLRAQLNQARAAASPAAQAEAAVARQAAGVSSSTASAARNVGSLTAAVSKVPRNTTFRVTGDTSQAKGAIGDILQRLSRLQNGKTVHVVQIIGDNQVNYGGGSGRAGGRTANAEGGWLRGGVPGRDSLILANGDLGMPDEFIVNRHDAKKNADLLEYINAGGDVTTGRAPRPRRGAAAAGGDVLQPIVLQVDGRTLWQSLVLLKNRKGGAKLGLA